MSKSYIPQNTFVICSLSESPTPQNLIATSYERQKFSTLYRKDKDKIFLKIGDRNTKEKFICAKPMNLALSIGGLVVGLILFSNPIGWVVLGICAVILVASVAIAIVTHDCSTPLKAGIWMNEKTDVKFDKQLAITESSLLLCDSGGVLQPIIDPAVTLQAAKAIAFENIKGTVIITASAIASGYFMGGLKGLVTSFKEMLKTSGALFTLGGIGATYAMTAYQSSVMRNNTDYDDNEIYQQMNKAQEIDYTDLSADTEEGEKAVGEAMLSGAPPNIKDLVTSLNLFKTGKLIIDDAALKAEFEELSKMNRSELSKNPRAKVLIKSIQS